MSWPQLGSRHRSGNRFVGRELGRVEPYWKAGTPIVNQVVQTTVDLAAVANVGIGDVLQERFDGTAHWWLCREGVRLGRLNWSLSTFEQKPWQAAPMLRVDEGDLEVTRLLLDPSGRVINCGGILRPKDR
ncbi:hypothetical protein [Agromyces bauzanensis]